MSQVIVAIATSTASNAGVNIIRLSGSNVREIADKIFYSKNIKKTVMEPNMMYLGTISGKNFQEQAFCVYYKMPKSYTGEDVVEFHCHGGKGIANAVFRLCVEQGARPAEAGEFTKRAFLNGKMNLAQAEGIMDIITAQSESEILQGYKLLSGEITKGIFEMEKRLLTVMAELEVRLDYPEETADEPNKPQKEILKRVVNDIDKLLEGAKLAKGIVEGINISIIGLPNVGKSSLLNGLLMEERAIVTDIAGTTRDTLSESIEIDGLKINLLDTAGIRESTDIIEKMGIERAKQAIKQADIIIFVMDLTQPETAEEREIEKLLDGKKVIRVANKVDIKLHERACALTIKANPPRDIEEVKKEILRLAEREKIFSTGILTRERHIFSLRKSKEHIEKAIQEMGNAPIECTLVDLREGGLELAKITGSDISESVIDEVFSTFCVGK